MLYNQDIAEILAHCEEKYPYNYKEQILSLSSDKKEIFVISDLHLASGKDIDGKYGGTENFLSDNSFQRFIENCQSRLNEKGSMLIINGDFIDFLRIIEYPSNNEDFEEWEQILKQVGISKNIPELKKSISKKEKNYGFKTNDFKSVWRLFVAAKGHAQFFDALAGWLTNGHRLIIVKGNHDLEWYWQSVRNYLRYVIAEHISVSVNKDLSRVLEEIVLPNIIFSDKALIIDNQLYVEHGHRFDKFSHVVGSPLMKNKQELNIPFGSFFNRYLLNQVELVYPFMDNVKPRESILHLLMREHFFLGVKVFFQHIPFMLKIIPKKYYKYMFRDFLIYAIPVVFIILWILVSAWIWLHQCSFMPRLTDWLSSKSAAIVLTPVKAIFGAALSYFFAQIVAYFRLEEPDYLSGFAEKVFDKNKNFRFVIFGHTHYPDQVDYDNRWFYNSGTWIPMIEISSAAVRDDKTYIFVHLKSDSAGNIIPNELQRWNDDAGRSEPMIIVKQKNG